LLTPVSGVYYDAEWLLTTYDEFYNDLCHDTPIADQPWFARVLSLIEGKPIPSADGKEEVRLMQVPSYRFPSAVSVVGALAVSKAKLDEVPLKFRVVKMNHFYEPQYERDQDGTKPPPLLEAGVWTIKAPSAACKRFYGSDTVRIYHETEYLLSLKAFDVIPAENSTGGAAALVTFLHHDEPYALFVADNKDYFQNVQGVEEDDDGSALNCIIRELKEETGIVVDEDDLHKVGEWSFKHEVTLVDWDRFSRTTVFHVKLAFEAVAHLFPAFKNGAWNVVAGINLHETEYVLAVPLATLEAQQSVQCNARTIKFHGHHPAAVAAVSGLKSGSGFKTSHLHSFNIKPE